MNYSNFIAALDIGSTRITLTLATRTTEGDINVIDTESADTAFVKHGVITNENGVAKEIQSLILKVQQRQHAIIEKVYVTTGGTLLQSEINTVAKNLGEGSIITKEVMISLHKSNFEIETAETDEILSVQHLSYQIDGEAAENIEGRVCNKVEGTYLVIKGKKKSIERIKNTLQIAEVQMAEMFIAPITIADTTLSENEKIQGAAAVEIGESTTKIAIYQNKKLQYVASIPLGMNLVTADLSTCLDIPTKTAELLKKDSNFGAVYSNLVEDADILLKTTSGVKKNFPSRMVVEIMEARIEEIILNVMYQIERSKFMFLLKGGLVISGSITATNNLTQFTKLKTDLNARIADIKPFFAEATANKSHLPESTEICGMLIKGETNCKKAEKKKVEIKEAKETATIKETPEPKIGKKVRGVIGDLFAGMFDETDQPIE